MYISPNRSVCSVLGSPSLRLLRPLLCSEASYYLCINGYVIKMSTKWSVLGRHRFISMTTVWGSCMIVHSFAHLIRRLKMWPLIGCPMILYDLEQCTITNACALLFVRKDHLCCQVGDMRLQLWLQLCVLHSMYLKYISNGSFLR
jgi:hypothetical protein